MPLSLFFAFLRRDVLSQFSYRLALVLDLLAILSSVATFYYVGRLFGPNASAAIERYGGDYFSFVLIGIAFSAYQGAGLRSFAQSIRQEQYLGTMEAVLAAPVSVPVFLLASAQWDFLYATLQAVVYVLAGALFFGLRFPDANLPAAATMLVLTLAACMSLGMLSAAFVVRFKRGDPVALLLLTVSELLGGVFFPVAVLPDWLRRLAQLVPMTHALEGLRLTLLKGAGLSQVYREASALGLCIVVFLPLGFWFFQRSLKAARRDGSLGHY